MASVIKHKRSSTPASAPGTSAVELGEIAVNTHDGIMFIKKDDTSSGGSIEVLGIGPDYATNVLYVSKSGNDSFSGRSLSESFLTIDAAVAAASAGTTIYVKSGDYTVTNPLVVPANVSLMGDNLRTTTIRGNTATSDILHLNNACYINGFTFRGHTTGAAAVAFPTTKYTVTISPYVQNCSSITSDGVGMKIDGTGMGGTRSMVADAFTQINEGGKGVYILNSGYAQLVSIFTVYCDVAVECESGGQCSLTNSNASFGNFGLKASGKGALKYSGTVQGTYNITASQIQIAGLGTEKPDYGDAIKFASDSNYYTVENATTPVAGVSTVTIRPSLDVALTNGESVEFYQRSLIAASSITFEYVGAGTSVGTALPESDGVPVQTQEVVEDSDRQGEVYFTSTDHKGDFRIGSELLIERESGTIQGTTFDRSLFAVLTPYILALED